MSFFEKFNDTEVVPLWINGKDQSVQSGHHLEVVQAVENKIVHFAQSANIEDTNSAVAAAASAFPAWSKAPLTQRRDILFRAADLLAQRATELGAMQALETSSAAQFGQHLSMGGAATVREIAAQITTAFEGVVPYTGNEGMCLMVTREAVGPVLLIPPWNSPTYLATRGIATALAAGCTVVLKASELCPATYRMICQTFADAGLPAGALNQIVSKREDAAAVTEAIISDRRIRKVEFIGSATVGRIIGQMCGKHLKPVLMELGGKCAAIICRDANLTKAAKASAFGAFLHHGQICMSTERIIVVKDVAEEFIALLEKEVQGWASQAGSAATKKFADQAHDLVEEALAKGAELIVGDNSYHGEHKTSLRPTIFKGVSTDSKIYDSESFGPSAALFVVDDEDAAVELVNSSEYGLNGAIWTNDIMRGLALSKRFEGGVVSVNDGTILTDIPPTAFGGATKGSGWGLVNGAVGIREFLLVKTVFVKSAS